MRRLVTGETPPGGFSGAYSSSGTNTVTGSSLSFESLQVEGGALNITKPGSANGEVFVDLDTSGSGAFGTGGPVDYIGSGSNIGDADGTTLYFSFLLDRDGAGANDFFQLRNGTTPLFLIGKSAGGTPASTHFQVRNTATNTSAALNPLNTDVNFYVGKLTFAAGDDTLEVFANPTPGGTEPGTVTASFTDDFAFDNIRMFSQDDITFDEIRFGTTYGDVVPIPEPTVGTLILGGAALYFLVRRRRNS